MNMQTENQAQVLPVEEVTVFATPIIRARIPEVSLNHLLAEYEKNDDFEMKER
jgi:hypothetical protein